MSGCKHGDLQSHVTDGTTSVCVVRESIPSIDVPFLTRDCSSTQDDELLSWLQYPTDDNLVHELLSDVERSHVEDTLGQQTIREADKPKGVAFHEVEFGAEGPKNLDQDAAVVMDVGRAVEILSQAGVKTFDVVRSDRHPPDAKGRNLHAGQIESIGMPAAVKQTLNDKETDEVHSQSLASPYVQRLNFSHFAIPVSHCKSGLQVIGVSSGPTNNQRLRQHCAIESCGRSIAECVPSIALSVSSQNCADRLETQQASSDVIKEAGMILATCSNGQSACPCGNLRTASEMVIDIPDTILSPSLSVSSNDKHADSDTYLKKKVDIEISDNQSKEFDEARNAQKSPSGSSSTTKRSRAAETHNESEKRRRNRINVRMKALQELVPNSTKTDKASMLDEVIEYMKTLKAQLQFMCMRTGVALPMMSAGMQYFPMQQVTTAPPMAMGLGAGMDMSMRMGLINQSVNMPFIAGHAGFAVPPIVGQPLSSPSCRMVIEMKPGQENPPSS